MEVNNKEREADLIRKFEKEELTLFYALKLNIFFG
jgi:hypothetical protein